MHRLFRFLAHHQTASSAAAILVVTSFLSKVLGLVRDRAFTATFGAGRELDAYYAAFRVPDLIFNLLIAGSFAATLLPILVDLKERQEDERALNLINTLSTIVFVVVGILVVVLAIFAHPFMRLMAPGFDPTETALAVTLTRIMIATPLLFSLGGIVGTIAQATERFTATAVAPLIYNVAIIVGTLAFKDSLGIVGSAYGVLLGAALHLLVQLPALSGLGLSFRPLLKLTDPLLKKIGLLMIPRSLGLAANYVMIMVMTIIASYLIRGSITVFTLAINIASIPVTLVGLPAGMAIFPSLARAASEQSVERFRTHFTETFRWILFATIPITAILILLRAHIVRLLFGAGAFDWEDTIMTLETVGALAVSIFAQALAHLVTRAFYALRDTRTPVIATLIGVVVTILTALVLAKSYGVVGLAIAFSVGNILSFMIMTILLRLRAGDLGDLELFSAGLKMVVAALGLGIVTYATLSEVDRFVDTHTVLGLALQAGSAGLLGVLMYAALAHFFDLREWRATWQWLRARLASQKH